ncbi:Uncharacterized conserved protein YqhQ [Butyrivibrio fibrisolvens DSM 3071]|jgi:uncharacterized protein YqhQ|uniref:Uncharacterized conserved protein YqhQ n=1 Tax=Butyrivibrio fibrisolvens DSM 3071 TaxID=1121131 RepID=A0A1M5ZN85_BUTFI|nr:DUF1385 domain-containing protein [Butyrivibrio fibrisolvens]SHI25373.1 Uncharacterized conserved protein YqhQ [Butyrivibrio fibrisolvens DSM 3071]
MKKKITHYSGIGGQAVLEGVMMRNKDLYAVAVRKPDGDVHVEIDEYHGVLSGSPLLRIPFIRGIFVFIDSLVLGTKALNRSADFYEDDAEDATAADKAADAVTGGKGDKFFSVITTVVAFALAIFLFLVLPERLSAWMNVYLQSQALQAVAEGIIRIAIFILYILTITLMPDIKRLFRYHGAEHKCINCIESGLPLTVANVKRSSRFHKRCGSSFILFVLVVSIILFMFINTDSIMMKLLYRVLLLPVVSGISYELIRFAGKSDNPVISIISKPGLLLQRLTTKEPDESMIEVGIASVEAIFDWRTYQKDVFGFDFADEDEEDVLE